MQRILALPPTEVMRYRYQFGTQMFRASQIQVDSSVESRIQKEFLFCCVALVC